MKSRFFLFFLITYCVFGTQSSVLAAKKKQFASRGARKDLPSVEIRREENPPLLLAVQDKNMPKIRSLIRECCDVNQPGGQGVTALILASQAGSIEVVQQLLSSNANPNHRRDDNYTALHHAAQNGHPGTVNLLLQAGAECDAPIYNGQTSLHIAAREGYDSTVKILLDAKASVNAHCQKGYSALHYALGKGSQRVFDFLVQAKADIDTQDEKGCTPLFIAIENGHFILAKELLEKGADLAAQTDGGFTPLMPLASTYKLDCLLPRKEKPNILFATSESTDKLKMMRFLRDKIKADKKPVCLGCGIGPREGSPLMACARCKAALYCCVPCQRADWTTTHKNECRSALEDVDLVNPISLEGNPFPFLKANESKDDALVASAQPVSGQEQKMQKRLVKEKEREFLQASMQEQERLRAQQEERVARAQLEANRVAQIQSNQLRDAIDRNNESQVRVFFDQGFRLCGADDTIKRRKNLNALLGHISGGDVTKTKLEKTTERRHFAQADTAQSSNSKNKSDKSARGNGKSSDKLRQQQARQRELAADIQRFGMQSPHAGKLPATEEFNIQLYAAFMRGERFAGDAEVCQAVQEQKDCEAKSPGRCERDYDVVWEHPSIGIIHLDSNHVFEGEVREGRNAGLHIDYNGKLESQGILKRVPSTLDKSGNGCYSARRLGEGQEYSPASSFFPSNWSRESLIKRIGLALSSEHTTVYFDPLGDTCLIGVMPKMAGDRGEQVMGEIYFKAVIKKNGSGMIRTVFPIPKEVYNHIIARVSVQQLSDSAGAGEPKHQRLTSALYDRIKYQEFLEFEQALSVSLRDYEEGVAIKAT